jgi:hypothetical protein
MDWWQSRMECEMTHDPTRDCEHGRLKGKCDVCDLQEENKRLTELLNNPEEHYPGNFDTPQRANALLTGLCQDAANEIAKLQAEVLEQCRVNGMSAEREDALRAELTRLKASIALDKKAENARELGLDYEPAAQEKCFLCGERVASCTSDVCPKSAQPAVIQQMVDALDHADELLGGNDTLVMNGAAAGRWLLEQPAVQEGRDWSLLEATQESLREHMAEIKRLKAAQPAPVQELLGYIATMAANDLRASIYGDVTVYGEDLEDTVAIYTTPPAAQPVPVKTYFDGKPWPVAPKPWVGLTPAEVLEALTSVDPETKRLPVGFSRFACAIEAKLKEKNHDH